MPSSKKPRKKMRVRDSDTRTLRTQPWKTFAVFKPLEDILNQLEDLGTVDVIASGAQANTPIFKNGCDNEWYETAPALQGVIEFFEIHAQRTGREINLDPLRKLAKKLEVHMPIFAADTAAAREVLNAMHAESNHMSPSYASDIVTTTQTAIEFERLNVI